MDEKWNSLDLEWLFKVMKERYRRELNYNMWDDAWLKKFIKDEAKYARNNQQIANVFEDIISDQ